ncbi:MAG TPA: hypothetical protein PLK12_03540 [Prolixibacteraceae bacterium]|nr:hypothetical protein [Prolixibacteraceae bacterium]
MKSSGIKIIFILAALIISMGSFAEKRQKATIDQRATLQMQKIHQVCNLSTEQQAQVKQVFVEKYTARQRINQQKENKTQLKSTEAKKQRRTERASALQATRQQVDQSMRNILTPEQVALWRARKQK